MTGCYESDSSELIYDQNIEQVEKEVLTPWDGVFLLPVFSETSVWNQPIDSQALVDSGSTEMIRGLMDEHKSGSDIVLSVHEWTTTVFFADETTVHQEVSLRKNLWQRYDYLLNVPIPEGTISDPENDGHLTIIDLEEGFVYEFWQGDVSKNGVKASWGNRISLGSDGIYPYGMSARGSGFSLIAGVIWPEELEAGIIEHALTLSIPNTRKTYPVYPATETDGRVSGPSSIPEGARVRLDPDLDLSLYNLTDYERIICECLQTYGAFITDTSSSIEFEAVNPLSYSSDPYNGMFDQQWVIMNELPLEHFQVLELGPVNKDDHYRVHDESIYGNE